MSAYVIITDMNETDPVLECDDQIRQNNCESNSINLDSKCRYQMRALLSVTRLGDLLEFGHLFKAFGKN